MGLTRLTGGCRELEEWTKFGSRLELGDAIEVFECARKRIRKAPDRSWGEFLDIGVDDAKQPHEVAQTFWRVVPPGHYDSLSARPIVQQYLQVVEERLASSLQRHCVAYWLHAYRRLYPGAIGYNDDPTTILLVRSTLEAAIQKYAQFDPCNGVGVSTEIDVKDIFKGLLLDDRLSLFRQAVQDAAHLVLTDFDTHSLRELYECEKMAFEIWRASATLRILGKGASLRVDPDSPRFFYDDRSDELNSLVTSYDSRAHDWNSSATGTVFSRDFMEGETKGAIAVPTYNVSGIPAEEFSKFFKGFNLKLLHIEKLNFVWVPFNLANYLQAHEPFAEAFERKTGIRLEWLMAVINALSIRVILGWNEDRSRLFKNWQRAYEGPYSRDFVEQQILQYLPLSVNALDLKIEPASIDVAATISYLELRREKQGQVDPATSGPHFVFLPFGNRLFIDYAWLHRLFYNLFFGVELADQNFKGEALEVIVRRGKSALPTGPCKSISGEKRQIDAAFDCGNVLVIAECRAFARSIGFDRGDPTAIRYRTQRIEKALKDTDEKAHWLAENPLGTNYDIRGFRSVLPIAVTPFAEFIPSTGSSYWINKVLPRVMTPTELRDALANGTFEQLPEGYVNDVRIRV